MRTHNAQNERVKRRRNGLTIWWSLDDALFPATRVVLGMGQQFEAAGLDAVIGAMLAPSARFLRRRFSGLGSPILTRTAFERRWHY